MKKKIKQYSFWTGLAGAVVILLTALSNAFGFEFEHQIVTDIIMAICGVLVVFGVVNAPLNTNQEDETNNQIIQEENNKLEKDKSEVETKNQTDNQTEK